MKQEKTYSFCVYTIVKPDSLDVRITKGNGSGCITEHKTWATAQKLLKDAKRKSEEMLVLFADASAIDELKYLAVLKDIEIGRDKDENVVTTYWFTDLVRLKRTSLKKTDLVLRSTGKKISPGFIRPYAICVTPERFLNKAKNK